MGKVKGLPVPISKEKMEVMMDQANKCICKIIINNEINGTGFFCKIPFPDSTHLLPVLMTHSHLLNADKIVKGQTIQFTMEEGKLPFKILLDINRITYISHKYNITIIEIKENDSLDINSFLKIDEQILSSDLNEKMEIYLLYYLLLNGKFEFSTGEIKTIKNDGSIFEHFCASKQGALGGPLINLNNFRVIGMHIGADKKESNLGLLLKFPILEFYNDNKNNNINKSKINNSFQNNNDNYINELNNKNTYLINEINKLEENLKKEKNENKILKEKIKNLEYQINEKNENINKSKIKIKELEETIKNKSKDNSNLQKIIKLMEELDLLKSKLPFELLEKEKLMVLTFISEDENFHYSTICKNTENFARFENLIYNEYPEYSNSENIFIVHNKVINKHKSLDNNGIKNNDIITIKKKNKEEKNKINLY